MADAVFKLGSLQQSIVEVDVLGSIYADPDEDPAQTAMADAILEHFTATHELLVKPEYAQALYEHLNEVSNGYYASKELALEKAAGGLASKVLKKFYQGHGRWE